MTSEIDRERTVANRDAVVQLLESKLRCEITTREDPLAGIYFNAMGFGRLQIGENLLADTDKPEDLIERLKQDKVVESLMKGIFVGVFTDRTEPPTG